MIASGETAVEPETGEPQFETPEEETLRTRQEMVEYVKRNLGVSDTAAILKYGRSGPMYGMPFVDDSHIRPDDE